MAVPTTTASPVQTMAIPHISLIVPLIANGLIFLYLGRSGLLKKISALTVAALKTTERSVSHLTTA